MHEIFKNQVEKTIKLKDQPSGVSTKNYVSVQNQQKRWLKKKEIDCSNREKFQSYAYSNIFAFNTKKTINQSFFNTKDVIVQIDLKPLETHLVHYTIERPLVNQSVRELFNFGNNEKVNLGIDLTELLQIYLDQCLNPLPVITPMTLLAKKNWSQTPQIHLNYTSLVGYSFLLQKSEILFEKFRQIYCYLHPKLLHLQKNENKIDFQCQLYSFAVNLLSIILKKEISFSLFTLKKKLTISLSDPEGTTIIEKNVEEMRKLIKSSFVKNKLKNASNQLNFPKQNNLSKFFDNVFQPEKCTFKNWSNIFQYFNPNYFAYYQQNTSQKMFKIMQKRYEMESQQQKKYYSKMGLINSPQNGQLLNKLELISYILVKYDALNLVKYQNMEETFFNPELYILYKRIQQQVLEHSKPEKEQDNHSDSDLELNFIEQIEYSKNFNIYSYKTEVTEEEGKEENKQIYVVNDFQETLNLYGSSLWF